MLLNAEQQRQRSMYDCGWPAASPSCSGHRGMHLHRHVLAIRSALEHPRFFFPESYLLQPLAQRTAPGLHMAVQLSPCLAACINQLRLFKKLLSQQYVTSLVAKTCIQ